MLFTALEYKTGKLHFTCTFVVFNKILGSIDDETLTCRHTRQYKLLLGSVLPSFACLSINNQVKQIVI